MCFYLFVFLVFFGMNVMVVDNWKVFFYDQSVYDYLGDKLKEVWLCLICGFGDYFYLDVDWVVNMVIVYLDVLEKIVKVGIGFIGKLEEVV